MSVGTKKGIGRRLGKRESRSIGVAQGSRMHGHKNGVKGGMSRRKIREGVEPGTGSDPYLAFVSRIAQILLGNLKTPSGGSEATQS